MKSIVFASVLLLAISTSLSGSNKLAEIENEIIEIVSKVSKSVVSVSAICPPEKWGYQFPSTTAKRIGCGIVIDSLGHVVTTGTIVDGAQEVEITTSDGIRSKGVVVGKDAISDIAVVRLSDPLSIPARFSTLKPKTGSMILIVGNAFGTMPSAVMGLVSGVQKDEEYGIGLLRIAAPISPGDIGGAVVNTSGEVLGLIQGRLVSPEYNADLPYRVSEPSGLALAIAAPKMLGMAREIIESGSVRRGFLGVRVVDVEKDKAIGNREPSGALVIDVVRKSPADSIGLRRGDVIIEFGSKIIDSASVLRGIVQKSTPGSIVEIRFRRGGNTFTRNVRIGARPDILILQEFPDAAASQTDLIRNRIRELEAEIKTLKQQLQEGK